MRCREIREECFKALPVEEKLSELRLVLKDDGDCGGKRASRLLKGKEIYNYNRHTKLKRYLGWCDPAELSFMRHKMRGEQLSHQAMGDLMNFVTFAIAAFSLLVSLFNESQVTNAVVLFVVAIIFTFMALFDLAMVLSRNGLRTSTYLVELIEEVIQEKRSLEEQTVMPTINSNNE